jgi:hypothetical protein
VYAVRSSDLKKLSVLAYQLRDRRMWDFQTNQVSSMTISIRGDSRKILRNASGQWILDQDAAPLTSPLTNIIDETLYRFGCLRSEAWVDKGDDTLNRYGFKEAAHQITIETVSSNKPSIYTLNIGAQAPSGHMYASTLMEGQRIVFELNLALYHAFYVEILRLLPAVAPQKP